MLDRRAGQRWISSPNAPSRSGSRQCLKISRTASCGSPARRAATSPVPNSSSTAAGRSADGRHNKNGRRDIPPARRREVVMSRIFGAVCQNGYIVRDIRAAMDHWVNVMGVGPWYYIDRVETDYFRHRGQDSAIEMSVGLGNCGDDQIEVIQ